MGMRLAVYIECVAMDMFGIVIVKDQEGGIVSCQRAPIPVKE